MTDVVARRLAALAAVVRRHGRHPQARHLAEPQFPGQGERGRTPKRRGPTASTDTHQHGKGITACPSPSPRTARTVAIRPARRCRRACIPRKPPASPAPAAAQLLQQLGGGGYCVFRC
ncbi:hypothetical protein AB4212_66515, partial [Streptomyces sp. 2MCAF27]